MGSWNFAFLIGLGCFCSAAACRRRSSRLDRPMKPRDQRAPRQRPLQLECMIPQDYQRHIVEYHRKEAPGTIVIDTDTRYPLFVQAGQQAIRYGVTVGEEAQGWSGVAKIGNMTEWPGWTPTAASTSVLIRYRNSCRAARRTRWARAPCISLPMARTRCSASTAPISPIYRTAISSGCIRLTNEDVIDLLRPDQDGYARRGAGAGPGRFAAPPAPRVQPRRGRHSRHRHALVASLV